MERVDCPLSHLSVKSSQKMFVLFIVFEQFVRRLCPSIECKWIPRTQEAEISLSSIYLRFSLLMFCTFPFSDSERRAHFQQFKVQSRRRRPERPEAARQETGGDRGDAAGGDLHWWLRLRLRLRLTHRHQRDRHRVSSSVQLCTKIFLWKISWKDGFWSDCKMIWTYVIFSKRWNFYSLVCWLLASSLASSGSAARSLFPGNYPPMIA